MSASKPSFAAPPGPELPGPREAKATLHELAGSFRPEGWTDPKPDGESNRPARQDVSRFKQLESLFGSLPDVLPDPLIVVNPQGLIVLANRQTAEMFGYSREELVGAPVELLIPSRYRREHVETREEYFKAPKPRPMGAARKLFGLRKDGSEFPVEISLSPFSTAEGLVVISTIRDISERVRLEKRYRTLIEGIPAVTFMAALDAGLSELYVSPQIEKLLGFTQQEWLEDPILWYRQLHPDDQVRWHTEFARTCATGGHFRAEYRFVARDGRVVWVLGEAKVVCSDNGRPLFMQGIAFDITPMKQAEEQLRAHQQDLERLVSERTAELEAKVDDLKQFTKFAAHEMKKPLRPIMGELSPTEDPFYLKTGRDLPPVREMASWVLARVKDGLGRLDAMRRWAEVDDGEAKRVAPRDSRAEFAAACDMLKETIAETGAQVASGPLPRVMVASPARRDEPCELVFLFENLMNNALKYRSPERPPRIRVEANRKGDRWEFSVQDNGTGIEARYFDGSARTQIFNMFQRLVLDSKIPGYGIGLAYCKRVVERLGGRIRVESTVGKGSTFFFTLPAVPGEDDLLPSTSAAPPGEAAGSRPTGRSRKRAIPSSSPSKPRKPDPPRQHG